MEYLLVDGYNIINAWTEVFNTNKDSLEECRDKLLSILSNYQGYKKINVIVVFDAYLVKGSQQKHENYDNITVVFTKENETADNYIERFVYRLGAEHVIRVATSDYLEQTIVLSKGGIRMSPRELLDEVRYTGKSERNKLMARVEKTNTIMSRIKPELFEKLDKMRKGKV
ncbi:MAG: NYN domain-containing protein [Clostridia bacterium]|nr:NYN domain-containing protein [Clostridia bacterium]